jgi:hypothetical protein
VPSASHGVESFERLEAALIDVERLDALIAGGEASWAGESEEMQGSIFERANDLSVRLPDLVKAAKTDALAIAGEAEYNARRWQNMFPLALLRAWEEAGLTRGEMMGSLPSETLVESLQDEAIVDQFEDLQGASVVDLDDGYERRNRLRQGDAASPDLGSVTQDETQADRVRDEDDGVIEL